jgi:hypothetical protein
MGTKERAGQPVRQASFICEGEYWTLGFEDRLIRLERFERPWQLALLLREPRREFHVLDLGTRIDPREIDARASQIDPEDRLTVRSNVSEGGGEPFDAQARAEYKQRLVELSYGRAARRARHAPASYLPIRIANGDACATL